MKTYQDLLAAGMNDTDRGLFCRQAVEDFMRSPQYAEAVEGEAYYSKHNTTIERYEKWLYTVTGRRVKDIFSSNHKLKTTFFRRLVLRQVQYVLGNGVTLQDFDNKEKLGRDFDFKLQLAAKRAMASGRAFGFWNYDHLEVFGYADTPMSPGFCPLYDENDAKLKAGIRYWFKKVDTDTIFRCTLYEADGFTDYRQKNAEPPVMMSAKQKYIKTIMRTEAGGVEGVIDDNYSDLPIVPLYANDSMQSELVGIRENIDCYDFIKSGLMNDIDDANGFYWVLKNSGGMDDVSLAQFIQRMKTVRAAVVEGDEVTAEPHTLDIPYQARQTALDLLRRDIYEDFQALDVSTLSAAAKTTQEIKAAYQAQDDKCADFEYYITDFVEKILELAGIDDVPTFTWNKIINQTEQVQMILQCANYLTDEMIIKLLPFLTPEQADEMIEQRSLTEYESLNNADDGMLTDEQAAAIDEALTGDTD